MRAAAVVVVFLLLAGAARADAPGIVRDLRPTTLEVGDTLIVECEGIRPPGFVSVELAGLAEDGVPVKIVALGRISSADRVLVDIDDELAQKLGGPVRVRGVTVQVAGMVTDGSRTWTTRPGVSFELDLFPRTLRALATEVGGGRPLVTAGIVLAVALILHLLVAPLTGVLVVWERKISGRMQSRLGPNRVGPRGWLQWLADGLKLITKEDLVPTDADPKLFRLAPYLMWMSVFATFIVLPLSHVAIVADMNVGVLYLLSVTSLTVIGILMGGWASNSKWALLGGMRSAAQIVSYELPASLALLQVALLAGSLSPQEIVRAQGGMPHEWFVFANPFAFVCFFIYFIAALAEGNRTPFDLPEAESELVAGYATEYSGFRFTIFSMAEWTNLYVIAAIMATLFLGGWNVPFVTPAELAGSVALHALSIAIVLFKIVALVFVIIWIRWTLPRLRIDQLMALCWKYLVPFAFAAFLAGAAWIWIVDGVPALDRFARWLTFLLGGVAVVALFAVRLRRTFRSTRLLYLGDKQLTLPWVERHVERR